DRRVVAHAVGCAAGFKRRHIDKRLERGTGLAARLGCAVELAGGIIIAADHGAYGTGTVDRDERALSDVKLLAVFVDQPPDRFFSELLQGKVDGGFDDNIAP